MQEQGWGKLRFFINFWILDEVWDDKEKSLNFQPVIPAKAGIQSIYKELSFK
jgi:hypothetical protein